jgi:DNA-directed RNA polymerase subunit RPC12/RpoP
VERCNVSGCEKGVWHKSGLCVEHRTFSCVNCGAKYIAKELNQKNCFQCKAGVLNKNRTHDPIRKKPTKLMTSTEV